MFGVAAVIVYGMAEPLPDSRPNGSYGRAEESYDPTARQVEDSLETSGDEELIRFSLSLSPEARLEVLQDFVDAFWTPTHG